MKQLNLTVTSRELNGRGPSRRLRIAGSIPAIIYGKSGNQSVSVAQEAFRDLMRAKGNAASLIDLSVDGKKMLSLIKEFQRHPITQKFLHIDIMEIDPSSPMSAAIPVRVKGEAHGVKTEGGTLAIVSQTINVRCLPKDLPEFIEIDVTELKVNESIHVGEVKAGHGTYVGSGSKRFFAAGDDDASDARIGVKCGYGSAKLVHQLVVERVELFGPIKRHDADPLRLYPHLDIFKVHANCSGSG